MNREVSIDGKRVEPAEADIVETEPGVYSVLSGGSSFEVRVTEGQISVGSFRATWAIEDPREWKKIGHAGGGHERATIQSAMPGKIIRILVAPGDEVAAGQGILVVEAMKMQNELKAPRAGRVVSIDVKPNDSVNAGAVLATIE